MICATRRANLRGVSEVGGVSGVSAVGSLVSDAGTGDGSVRLGPGGGAASVRAAPVIADRPDHRSPIGLQDMQRLRSGLPQARRITSGQHRSLPASHIALTPWPAGSGVPSAAFCRRRVGYDVVARGHGLPRYAGLRDVVRCRSAFRGPAMGAIPSSLDTCGQSG